jgi:hypothetical protein
MGRSKHIVVRDSHHTVSAGILDALGRGFLIATAGVVAGAMFGTANLAALSLWTIGVAAASGVGCMIGSALVRNAGCDRCEKKPAGASRAKHARKTTEVIPAVEAARDVAPEERWTRRIAMAGQQCEHGTGTGRGL